jgi:quinol monooxygenase YgiN
MFSDAISPAPGTVIAYFKAMVQMILNLAVRPSHSAGVLQALRSLMLALPAAPGFISCQLYVEAGVPNSLCYVEEWQTAQDLDQQIRSSHWTRLLALMEEAVEPPGLRLQWVTDVKGLEYLEAVRLGGC